MLFEVDACARILSINLALAFNGFKELIRRDNYLGVLFALLNDLKNIEENPGRTEYGLGMNIFYTKALFDCLNSEQIIEHL